MEIVRLIGADVLPDDQKLLLEMARVVRVGYLQQNSFHKEDTYVPMEKQLKMLQVIHDLNQACLPLVKKHIPMSLILKTGIFEEVIKIKYTVLNDHLEVLDDFKDKIHAALATIR